VQTGEQPLVLRIVPDASEMLAEAKRRGQLPQDASVQMALEFEGWQPGVELGEGAFAFNAPPGAQKVSSLIPEPPKHQLIGQQAPEFTLDLLDGGKLDLKAHRGKHVVVLDFWATWCGPCRRGLPILTEVTQAYKDKGVRFYAVNQEEKPEAIRKFLKEEVLQCTVALDTDGSVAQLYGVRGIPQTVLIGKGGMVQAVHVGLLPDMKSRLEDELDALVAGKSLLPAQEEGAEAPAK
jgi:thiol-disulfide isomerase/thioredoxin